MNCREAGSKNFTGMDKILQILLHWNQDAEKGGIHLSLNNTDNLGSCPIINLTARP